MTDTLPFTVGQRVRHYSLGLASVDGFGRSSINNPLVFLRLDIFAHCPCPVTKHDPSHIAAEETSEV